MILRVVLVILAAQAAAVVIPYAAWKGYPRNFNREKFFIAFLATGASAGVLLTATQRIEPSGMLMLIGKVAGGYLAILMMGISVGAMISVLTYRHRDTRNTG